ncbi:hypothetical protein NMG60_11025532 [Bertholletia excelsa]
MNDFAGTPGTKFGLVLRVSQCLFAAASIASLATTDSFFTITAFCYLFASMGLQAIWSFGLSLLDTYALVKGKAICNGVLIILFAIVDWVSATLSLAAASASAGTVMLLTELGGCRFGEECQKYQISVVFGFLGWLTVAISSIITLWVLAAE